MHAFFPDRVAVQGWGADVFWIEGGMRRPVEGALGIPSVRLSKVDLRRWPLAAPISALEAERRWHGIDDGGTGAGVALLPDGTPYHLEGNTVRRIISSTAMQAWQLHLKPLVTMAPEQLADKAEGLPIVAPPQIRQRL
jgi:hypothetical protein